MRRHRRWFFAAAVLTLLVDQISKALIRAYIPLGASVPIIPNAIYLTYTQNLGAAFGLFPNATMLLIIVALFVSAVFLWLGRQGFDRRRVAIATGMMLGGAVGNLLDRLRFGAVTDFVDLRVWPIFNFADTALTVGALLLLWWGAVAQPSGSHQKTNESLEDKTAGLEQREEAKG